MAHDNNLISFLEGAWKLPNQEKEAYIYYIYKNKTKRQISESSAL